MEITKSLEMPREMVVDGVKTKSDLVTLFDTFIDAALAKKGKGFVSIMVGEGERQIVLKRLREYMNHKLGHCRLESVLKVVQEERG